jgi:hypothetical protein
MERSDTGLAYCILHTSAFTRRGSEKRRWTSTIYMPPVQKLESWNGIVSSQTGSTHECSITQQLAVQKGLILLSFQHWIHFTNKASASSVLSMKCIWNWDMHTDSWARSPWPESTQCFPWLKTKTKLHGLSPRANYTDRATAACRRSDCQLLRIEGATWSAW